MIKNYQNKQFCFNFGSIIIFTCFFIISFYVFDVKSQEINNYNSCKKINGNYRIFGNNCLDNCLSQFNKSSLCVNQPIYGCDCGTGNCFYQNKCLAKNDFKPIFKELLELQEEKDSKRIEQIRKLMSSDPSYAKAIHDIFAGYEDPKTKELKSHAQLMSEKFTNEASQYIQSQQEQQAQAQKDGQAIQKTPIANSTLPTQKMPVIEVAPIPAKIPQFYIDQQKTQNSDQLKLPLEELNMMFPVIPLPGSK